MSDLERMLQFSKKHCHKLQKYAEILKRHLNIEDFWYAKTTADGKHCGLQACFSYQEYFFESEAYTRYPLIMEQEKIQQGYLCYSTIDTPGFQDHLEDCYEKFTIMPAFVILKRIQGDLVRIGYGISNKHYGKKVQNLINHVHLLEDFHSYFLKEEGPLIRELDGYHFQIPRKIKKSLKNPSSSPHPHLRANFYEELHGLKAGILHTLSSRENECMNYLHQGLNTRQIGHEMHISYRTVEHHIENIKLKLECESRSELILYASLMTKCMLFD